MSSLGNLSSKGTVMAAVALNDTSGISRCTAGCFHCIVQSVSESGWVSTKRSYMVDACITFDDSSIKSYFLNRNIREQRPSTSIMPLCHVSCV